VIGRGQQCIDRIPVIRENGSAHGRGDWRTFSIGGDAIADSCGNLLGLR
jgi:hypothetical protein